MIKSKHQKDGEEQFLAIKQRQVKIHQESYSSIDQSCSMFTAKLPFKMLKLPTELNEYYQN